MAFFWTLCSRYILSSILCETITRRRRQYSTPFTPIDGVNIPFPPKASIIIPPRSRRRCFNIPFTSTALIEISVSIPSFSRAITQIQNNFKFEHSMSINNLLPEGAATRILSPEAATRDNKCWETYRDKVNMSFCVSCDAPGTYVQQLLVLPMLVMHFLLKRNHKIKRW